MPGGGTIVLLDTSAYVIYALRASYRVGGRARVFEHPLNSVISRFLGFCKQRGIRVVISKTVAEELDRVLTMAINRRMDEAGLRSYLVRQGIRQKCLRRAKRLGGFVEELEIGDPLVNRVRRMYLSSRDKLARVKEAKGRRGLYPSETDMRILAEAAKLAGLFNVYLVSADMDFTCFKEEALRRLNVKIVHVSELVSLMKKLRGDCREA